MARLRPDCYPLEFRRGPLGHLSLSAPIGCANTRLDLASPRSRNHNLCRVAQAPQPGAAMKGTSLLLVLLLAKLAMAWGHASTLTGWSLVAYTWQDVLVALAFAGLEGLRKRLGVTPRISWGLYWVLAIYAAINVPVARALSTPLTWPMIRSERGPLADSILLYVTPTNCLVIALILLLAAVLPHLLRRVPQPHAKAWATCATIFALLGLIARTRADTRGMDRNAVTALIDTGLPRVTANADASDWRALRFTAQDGLRDVDGGAHENLSWLQGSARGRNVVMVGLESTAAQYLSLYGGQYKVRSEEHTSELQSRLHLVCRLLLEKKKNILQAHRQLVVTLADDLVRG